MAKDKMTVFIKNISIGVIRIDSCCWESNYYEIYKPNDKENYSRRQSYYYGSMTTESGILYVEYLRRSAKIGDLLVSFNVSNIFNGNNGISKSSIEIEQLINYIYNDLRHSIYVELLPDFSTWKVSSDETNIDLIDTISNLKSRFDILKKIKIPYKKIDYSFSDNGTLYFYSGKSWSKSSAVIIVYFKGKEQERKYNKLQSILDIGEDMECLRIEVKDRKNPLYRKIKKVKAAGSGECTSNLGTVMSKEYQEHVINDFILKSGLDKIITTKANLYQVIDTSPIFTARTRLTCKRVIRYLNREMKGINLNPRTIERYKRKILSTGYHYMYANVELRPITIADIRDVIDKDKSLCLESDIPASPKVLAI